MFCCAQTQSLNLCGADSVIPVFQHYGQKCRANVVRWHILDHVKEKIGNFGRRRLDQTWFALRISKQPRSPTLGSVQHQNQKLFQHLHIVPTNNIGFYSEDLQRQHICNEEHILFVEQCMHFKSNILSIRRDQHLHLPSKTHICARIKSQLSRRADSLSCILNGDPAFLF